MFCKNYISPPYKGSTIHVDFVYSRGEAPIVPLVCICLYLLYENFQPKSSRWKWYYVWCLSLNILCTIKFQEYVKQPSSFLNLLCLLNMLDEILGLNPLHKTYKSHNRILLRGGALFYILMIVSWIRFQNICMSYV